MTGWMDAVLEWPLSVSVAALVALSALVSWLVLLIGAVPTVAYPLLFSSKHAWVQTAITGSILVIVTLGLMVTLALQTPFRGEVSIASDAFREVLESFRNRLLSDPSALNPINAEP